MGSPSAASKSISASTNKANGILMVAIVVLGVMVGDRSSRWIDLLVDCWRVVVGEIGAQDEKNGWNTGLGVSFIVVDLIYECVNFAIFFHFCKKKNKK